MKPLLFLSLLLTSVAVAGLWQRGDDVRELNDDGPWRAQGWQPVSLVGSNTTITTNITARNEAAWTNWYMVKVQFAALYGYSGTDNFSVVTERFMAATNAASAKHALLAFALWTEAGRPEPWLEPVAVTNIVAISTPNFAPR